MRILFLNQYSPPDPAPTGILLRELADHLVDQGHEARFVSSRQDYRAAKKNQRRVIRELRALWEIFRQGMKAPRPDVVISATSPPLLVVIAALVALRHRARHAHWLFDMYPELAIALGEIPRGGVARFFETITRWAYRRTDLVVELDADMAKRLRSYGVHAEIIPPWVFAALLAQLQAPVADSAQSRTWLYSGNLGRAHEWETLLEAQSILEKRGSPWRLVFQGGGPSWAPAQARAKELGLQNCEWKTYVPESELRDSLLRAEVLAVTQRPETQGLLWPSKLGLISSLPRRILWVGPAEGAIAQELRAYPHAGVFPPGKADEIASWIEAAPSVSFQPRDALAARDGALKKWAGALSGLCSRGS